MKHLCGIYKVINYQFDQLACLHLFLMINSSILKRMLRFFYFSVWIYKMIILHWKGDNYACFNYKTFLHGVSPFVLCKEKVIISFWSYFINEWMLFLWMVSVWNRLCIFKFFFDVRLKQGLGHPQWFTLGSCGCCFCCFELFWHLCKVDTSTKHPVFVFIKKKNIKSFISAHLIEFAQNLLIFSHIMTHSLIIQLSFSSVFILNCLVDSTPKISMICFILSIFDLFIIFLILFLGQSGGMDEELFTKSFEDVPKVQVGLSFLGK